MRKSGVVVLVIGLMIFVRISFAQESVPDKLAPPPSPRIEILDFKDIDIKDALKFLAQKTGLRVVAGEGVQGKITVYAENVDGEEALFLMLRANKLACVYEGALIQVMPEAEYEERFGRPFSQRTITRLIHLKGLKQAKAAVLLEKMKSAFGKVVADESSATILMDDTAENIKAMSGYLEEIDQAVWPRVFALQYVEVESVLPRVAEIVTPEIGMVRADGRSNKIFVTDTLEKLEEIERLIVEIDVARTPAVFDLSYAKAEDILETVKGVLTPSIGWAQIGKRGNQLIVIDAPAKVSVVARLLQIIDRKEKEVLIEARIVQVVLKDEYRMGIDWEALIRNAHGLKLASNWGGVASAAKASVAIGTLSDDGYHAVLEALGTDLKSHVLSNPRIAVLNHEEARILVGTTRPYVTTTMTNPVTGLATVAEEVKFIDVGVKLVVTPTVHADGFITMKIKPEVSSAANSVRTGQNNLIPVVDTSELETTVRVKDGVTVVLGGLIKDEQARSGSKVPVLGDVPIVGGAFRSRTSAKEKTEIVIFLTPRIIEGD
jgi:general secretion pathway protein D